ncbi:MAG: (2Fe-2S)-binding protein [Alphaproteobacteria bacterium]|nr:(2Fe-2S)-binding protein [Alphaproteobacteria bacterium]
MFRTLRPAAQAEAVTITYEGRPLSVPQGISIAAALLGAGEMVCKSMPTSGADRAPYCLMGACFDCQVLVDEQPTPVQACLTPVRPGLAVRRVPRPTPVPEGVAHD